jgi:hypothetical protein
MDTDAGCDEETIEAGFARTIKYIDLYLRQKTDLYLQCYVFDPIEFLMRQVMYLSVIVTLFAAGTIILVMGVVLFIATIVPLWAALLITGALIGGLGLILANKILSDKIVLRTPVAQEMMKNGKP